MSRLVVPKSTNTGAITPLAGEIIYDSTQKFAVLGDGTSVGGRHLADHDYVDNSVSRFQSVLMYPTTSTSADVGTITFNTAPTGTGTEVPAWGGVLTTSSRKLYTFSAITPEASIISSNNVYNLFIPFRNLATNRTYSFRIFCYVQHASINSGNPLTIFDKNVTPFLPNTSSYNLNISYANENEEDITLPAGGVVAAEVWGAVTLATGSASLLINDSDNACVVARNEKIGQSLATGILTYARGVEESQESFNSFIIVPNIIDLVSSGSIPGVHNAIYQTTASSSLLIDIPTTLTLGTSFEVWLNHTGSGTITFSSNVSWSGTAPDLSAVNRYYIKFYQLPTTVRAELIHQ